MWQCRPRSRARAGSGSRDDRRHLCERDAELLVLARGGEVLVGGGVHAAVHAEADRCTRCARRLRRRPGRPPARSRARSRRRRPRPRGDLRLRLVVAVEARAPGWTPAASARASSPPVQTSIRRPGLEHPAHDVGREERLARVVDVRPRPRGARRADGGRAHPARAPAHLPLVDHVERGAELRRERGRRRRPRCGRRRHGGAGRPDVRRERAGRRSVSRAGARGFGWTRRAPSDESMWSERTRRVPEAGRILSGPADRRSVDARRTAAGASAAGACGRRSEGVGRRPPR